MRVEHFFQAKFPNFWHVRRNFHH